MSNTNGHARSASSGPRKKTRASSPGRAGGAKPVGASAGKEMDRRVEPGHDVGANGMADVPAAAEDLLRFANARRFATILADPPWQFTNKTGKVAPEHKRLARYGTMTLAEIMALPVGATRRADRASLSLVPERVAARRHRGDEGVGLHLQVQHRLAQGAQGRRLGRARRRLLLPQRHRARAVRRARQECAHAGARGGGR